MSNNNKHDLQELSENDKPFLDLILSLYEKEELHIMAQLVGNYSFDIDSALQFLKQNCIGTFYNYEEFGKWLIEDLYQNLSKQPENPSYVDLSMLRKHVNYESLGKEYEMHSQLIVIHLLNGKMKVYHES